LWGGASDAIAGWGGDWGGGGAVGVVEAVGGLSGEGEVVARLSVGEVGAVGPDGVDKYLPNVLERADVETWVIGGRDPARVVELFERGTTVGTRIGPERLVPWRHG
jgi:aspartokinase-like uncharacterized kinase